MNERLAVNAAEAAELLGISLPMLRQLTRRADFPAVKLGRRWVLGNRRATNGNAEIRRHPPLPAGRKALLLLPGLQRPIRRNTHGENRCTSR